MKECFDDLVKQYSPKEILMYEQTKQRSGDIRNYSFKDRMLQKLVIMLLT